MLNCAKLHEKSCSYLLIMFIKKATQKVKRTKFGSARAICNLNCVTTFHCLTKNALVFTQSDARNFFMYSIISPTN